MEAQIYSRYKKISSNQKRFLVDESEFLEAVEPKRYYESNEEYIFGSRVNMDYPTDVWCQQFEKVSHNAIIYIFGLGHFWYLKKLVKKVKYAVVVIYEPEIDNYIKFLNEDIDDVLETKNLFLITGKNRQKYLSKSLNVFLNYYNRKQLYIANIPNYIKRYEDDYTIFSEIIKKKCDTIIFDKSTEIFQENVQTCNYNNNIFTLVDEAGMGELYEVVQKFVEYPAVIVSAGPSLDKNVKLLGGYKGRVFIVAVDAALNTLKRNHIVPDLIVTMDPKFEKIDALEDKNYNRLPMIVNIISGPRLLEHHEGRKFFDIQNDHFVQHISEVYKIVLPILATGGSVANSAFSFLESAGFKNIILIGQDLGYPENKLHASDAFKNEGLIEVESGKYYYVEDIYGGKVLTEKNMDLYRLWFEDTIKERDDLNVIDCTEGGALIHGTTILPLKEALERYCIYDGKNFVEIINHARYLFDANERKNVQEYITQIYETIDIAIRKLSQGKKYYNSLEELYRKGQENTIQFTKTLDKIRDLVYYVDNDPQMALISQYAVRERTDVIDGMEASVNNQKQEINMLVETGRRLLDAYVLAGNKLKEEWKKRCNKAGTRK